MTHKLKIATGTDVSAKRSKKDHTKIPAGLLGSVEAAKYLDISTRTLWR